MKKYNNENHDTWLDLFTTHNNLNTANTFSNSLLISLLCTISLMFVGIVVICITKIVSFNKR
jgi:hypothetical protein